MSDTNTVVLEGRLTRSAELKYGKNNNAVVTFSIANNESIKNADGKWDSIPNFFDCVMFGKYAESMSKHLTKGRSINVTGRLKQDRWEKDGQKMSKVTVRVMDVSLGPINTVKPESSGSTDFPPADDQPFDESGNVIY